MLVAASDGLALVRADAPQDRQLVPARLRGRPTSAAALSQRLAVVACSEGQLLLLDLHRLEAAPVAARLPSAAPTCLTFMPTAGEAAEQAAPLAEAEAEAGAPTPALPAGLLFVGSSSGSSAFLELPAWRAVPAGDTAQLAASMAPISSACLFEDDCGDGRLLACCGQPPFARLALGRLAAGLSRLASGGGDLPVGRGGVGGAGWGAKCTRRWRGRSVGCTAWPGCVHRRSTKALRAVAPLRLCKPALAPAPLPAGPGALAGLAGLPCRPLPPLPAAVLRRPSRGGGPRR